MTINGKFAISKYQPQPPKHGRCPQKTSVWPVNAVSPLGCLLLLLWDVCWMVCCGWRWLWLGVFDEFFDVGNVSHSPFLVVSHPRQRGD